VFEHEVHHESERLKKEGLIVQKDLITDLFALDIKLKEVDLREMKKLQKNGGDPNKYLEKLIVNGGIRGKSGKFKPRKIESFPRLAARIQDVILFQMESGEASEEVINYDIQGLIEALKDFEKHIS